MAKTQKGAKSKEIILNAALKLFNTHGFHQTSFQMIATAINVSQSALFHHFQNKNELLEELLIYITKFNHSLVSNKILIYDSAQTRFKKHFLSNFEWADQYPEQTNIIILLYALSSSDSKFMTLLNSIIETGRLRLTEYLFMAQREDMLHKNINPEIWGIILHNSLSNLVFQTSTILNKKSQKEKRLYFENYLAEIEKIVFK